MPLTTYVFNAKTRKWVNKKSFVISVPLFGLSSLMHCGDFLTGWPAFSNVFASLVYKGSGYKVLYQIINACHSFSTTILHRSE